ncbi:CCC motif membrane protein [Flavobacterium orientale]|uniref:Interferon-induced transmembrane protein n=1 Tax=Flavobacterium orientale TaxID=1756020 RepID=A0A916Y6C8_9FLAO|nr:CCC motif membrane protein [Flavobacterium orientale]GGD32967.1 hypothetical protein GCM10011343_23740 [Flavobacterium orientale]
MEKQKLPNQTAIIILGLTSFVGCCCTNGVLGVILAYIGLHLAKKDEKLYAENPEVYDIGSLSTWKTVNLISLIISALFVVWLIYALATGGFNESMEQYQKIIEQLQNQ